MLTLGCVILASGEASRFGENKLLVEFCQKPLLAHTLCALAGAFSPWVTVTRDPRVAELAKAYGCETILHDQPHVSDTIRLGLSRMENVDGCLFCVGDQPLLTRETILRVRQAFTQHPNQIVRAAYGERVGNPVLFPKCFFEELKALNDEESGGLVAHRRGALTVQATFPEELRDVDTRDELLALQTIFQKKGDRS